MKEIKFRAWYGQHDLPQMIPYEVPQPTGMIVMQYTGLKDKNGKEIYFDDILKFSFHDVDDEDENYGGTALVAETMNGGAGLLFDFLEEENEVYAVSEGGQIEEMWPDDDLWTFEVVGNCFENPELLTH